MPVDLPPRPSVEDRQIEAIAWIITTGAAAACGAFAIWVLAFGFPSG